MHKTRQDCGFTHNLLVTPIISLILLSLGRPSARRKGCRRRSAAMTDPILTARGSDWETPQGAVEIMPVAVRAAVDVCPSPAAMLAPRVVVWCTERGCRTCSRRPSEEGCRRHIARRPFRRVAEIARHSIASVAVSQVRQRIRGPAQLVHVWPAERRTASIVYRPSPTCSTHSRARNQDVPSITWR